MAGVNGLPRKILKASPAAGLLLLAGVAWVALPESRARSGGTQGDVHIRLTARDFAFTPAEITVDPGDRVTIELEAGDVVHGLHIEGYDVDLTADPGQPATASFVADRTGTFRFRCSVPCGPLHPFMSGTLRVGPPTTFWQALVLAVAAVVVGGLVLNRPTSAPRDRVAPS